jgi:hypothetical protein
MITRTLVLAAVSTLVFTASAAAAKPKPYSGASTNEKIYVYGDTDARTDHGKVTFLGGSNAVTRFKLKGAGVHVRREPGRDSGGGATIKLNSNGKGRAPTRTPTSARSRSRSR